MCEYMATDADNQALTTYTCTIYRPIPRCQRPYIFNLASMSDDVVECSGQLWRYVVVELMMPLPTLEHRPTFRGNAMMVTRRRHLDLFFNRYGPRRWTTTYEWTDVNGTNRVPIRWCLLRTLIQRKLLPVSVSTDSLGVTATSSGETVSIPHLYRSLLSTNGTSNGSVVCKQTDADDSTESYQLFNTVRREPPSCPSYRCRHRRHCADWVRDFCQDCLQHQSYKRHQYHQSL